MCSFQWENLKTPRFCHVRTSTKNLRSEHLQAGRCLPWESSALHPLREKVPFLSGPSAKKQLRGGKLRHAATIAPVPLAGQPGTRGHHFPETPQPFLDGLLQLLQWQHSNAVDLNVTLGVAIRSSLGCVACSVQGTLTNLSGGEPHKSQVPVMKAREGFKRP